MTAPNSSATPRSPSIRRTRAVRRLRSERRRNAGPRSSTAELTCLRECPRRWFRPIRADPAHPRSHAQAVRAPESLGANCRTSWLRSVQGYLEVTTRTRQEASCTHIRLQGRIREGGGHHCCSVDQEGRRQVRRLQVPVLSSGACAWHVGDRATLRRRLS